MLDRIALSSGSQLHLDAKADTRDSLLVRPAQRPIEENLLEAALHWEILVSLVAINIFYYPYLNLDQLCYPNPFPIYSKNWGEIEPPSGDSLTLKSSKGILARIDDIKKAIGVLVLSIDLRHCRIRLWHHIVGHKHKERLLSAQLNVLPNLADEFGHADISWRKEFLLVNIGDPSLRITLDNDRHAAWILLENLGRHFAALF